MLVAEIWLSEPYYREYRDRKGVLFLEVEKTELFKVTQELHGNWPKCATDRNTPPEVGMKAGLFYTKCDFTQSKAVLRVAFGCHTMPDKSVRLVALTARTKQEVSKGAQNGTQGWYRHMSTTGLARWNDYHRGLLAVWQIY
jgi:hypothetical protein